MAAPTNCVEVVRLTYGWYVVTAFDLFGRRVRQRQSPAFSTEGRRRAWAIKQAELYAEQFGLWFDGRVWD